MIHASILDTVGRTPVVRIHRLAPAGVEMYVKLEAFNPMSSVKDRLALAIVLDAEAKGLLKPGHVILAMLPDTGERYLSTFLFEGVNEGSDDDWLAGLPG